jgi:hypothetical protein
MRVARSVAALTAGAALAVGLAVPASASVTAKHGTGWYDVATCKAYFAWDARPSSARFRVIVRDAKHAGGMLAQDVGVWAADLRAGNRAALEADRGEVWGDCITVLYGD